MTDHIIVAHSADSGWGDDGPNVSVQTPVVCKVDGVYLDSRICPVCTNRPDDVWRDSTYHGLCKTCRSEGREVLVCDWVSCPTGGWWAHRVHPDDDHDADIGWQPPFDDEDGV